MIDQRENILQRLIFVCAGIEGVEEVARNRLDVMKLRRPAVVILDGSEQLAIDQPPRGRGASFSEIQLMELSPLIAIYMRGSNSAESGSLLSLYRSRTLSAILNDDSLREYVGSNGSIRYEGAAVSPPEAEGHEFRLDLAIAFTYPFRLSDIST